MKNRELENGLLNLFKEYNESNDCTIIDIDIDISVIRVQLKGAITSIEKITLTFE